MRCPHCDRELGDGMLPARCPSCGAQLSNATDRGSAQTAEDHRKSVEGLSGVGKGNAHGRRYRHRGIIAVVLVVVFGVLLVGTLTFFGVFDAKTIPDVVGWNKDRAVSELQADGYAVDVQTKATSSAFTGTVVSQDPQAGSTINAGTPVVITVAIPRDVPQVIGMDRAEALKEFESLDIPVTVDVSLSNENDGTVIATKPNPGTPLDDDQSVALTVSQRPRVPVITGQSEAKAKELLGEQTLTLTVKNVMASKDHPEGTIVSQNPAAGATVDVDSAVTAEMAVPKDAYLKQQAQAIIGAVFTGTPGAGVGGAVKPYLSKDSGFKDKSDEDIWKDFLKEAGSKPPSGMDASKSKRSVESVEYDVKADENLVVAKVKLSWSEETGNTGYVGRVESQDLEVRLGFDDAGLLRSFEA